MMDGTTTEWNFLGRMLLSPPFGAKSGDCASRRSLSMLIRGSSDGPRPLVEAASQLVRLNRIKEGLCCYRI